MFFVRIVVLTLACVNEKAVGVDMQESFLLFNLYWYY